jgi:hypothetical protein
MASPRWASARSRCSDGAAAVTDPAARRLLFPEIPPDEHAAALLGLGVIGDGPYPALALVTKRLELCDEIRGAGLEDFRRRHNDAPLLIALYETGLLKIRQQYLANPQRYAGRVRECGGRRSSVLGRPGGERRLKPRQVPDGRTAQSLKPLLDVEVSRVE